MIRQRRIVYELPNGLRGVLFISTLSESGALQLFAKSFPQAKVVRVSVEPSETHYYEVPR